MDFVKVKSLEQALTYLQDLLVENKDRWNKTLEEGAVLAHQTIRASTTVEEVEKALNDLIQELFSLIQTQRDGSLDPKLAYTCVECCATARLHDVVFGALCAHLDGHDSTLRKQYIGSYGSSVVPLMAAVVELSNLDAHTNALEKLACLCTTHDMVYAELKAALIELQADDDGGGNSTDSGAIVVIERDEVVALLVEVIARSKPSHLYTNLYYIQMFGTHLFDNSITRQICEDFNTAVEKLSETNISSTQASSNDQQRHLDLSDIVQLAAETNDPDSPMSNILLRKQRKRLLDLITTATTQHL